MLLLHCLRGYLHTMYVKGVIFALSLMSSVRIILEHNVLYSVEAT